MVLNLSISPEAEAKLKSKAAAAGVDVETYTTTLVERLAKAPMSLKEISGPIAEEFAKSGMTEAAYKRTELEWLAVASGNAPSLRI